MQKKKIKFTWLKGFKKKKEKSRTEVPVDPTDQVMLRLKLLDAFIDISRFLLAFRMIGTEEDKTVMAIQNRHIEEAKKL